jgi:plastocyanin
MQNEHTDIQKASKSVYVVAGIVLAVVILGLVIFLRGSQGETSNTGVDTVVPGQDADQITTETELDNSGFNVEGVESQDSEIRTISVEAGSYYFSPNEIRVKKGETITIVITGADTMHDFIIDELGVVIPLTEAGDSSSVTFTADTVGNFEFYCSVGQHRQLGQTGTLVVED